MGKKLSIEEQISILENTKKIFLDENNECDYICHAMCTELYKRELVAQDWVYPFHPEKYIPICTRDNATIVCREANVELPYQNDTLSWWYHNQREPRIVFIDWMINELKTRLSTNNP